MSLFDAYARFYDLLYKEKDYEGECDFLEGLFRRFASREVESILDLGCGTAGHLLPLARRGYADLAGVDRSEIMLSAAREKAAARNAQIAFRLGDMRNARLDRTFDAVLCMFDAICYQTADADLRATVQTARAHLKAGGLFIFDAWFGPGVLSDPPTIRVRRIDLDSGETILRLAEPGPIDAVNHVVEVRYTVFQLRGDRLLDRVSETHRVRFLFAPETRRLLEEGDFELAHLCPLWDDRELTLRDWHMMAVGRAV